MNHSYYLSQKAKSYATRTGMDADHILWFLQKIMKERKFTSPRDIRMAMIGDHYLRTIDGDELRIFEPRHVMVLSERGEFYENAILARQERFDD